MEQVISYSESEDFIDNLADFIESRFLKRGKDVSRLSFVFGGKRPSLFLKKELSRRIGRGFFSPAFFSVDEFIEYCVLKKGAFTRISDLDACHLIYSLAQEVAPDILEGRGSFSRFLPWAREILTFIEQLDLEDTGTQPLETIQLKARIGYDVPENINALLGSIVSLREAYHRALAGRNAYSRGLMYLSCSRSIQDITFAEFDHIIFCGFFYLHKTEQDIIKKLYERNAALLIFQGDEDQWSVLKDAAKLFSCRIKPAEDKPPEYRLSVLAGFDVHSEACLVREVIRKIPRLEKTAIVLPLPEHIIPLLCEIGGEVEDFNVSMGYPLKRSSLYSLLEAVFKAQETRGGGAYYSKDYLRVVSHPLIKNLKIFPNPSVTRVLVHKIEEILSGIEKTSLGGSLFTSLTEIEHTKDVYDLALTTMKRMDIEVSTDELKQALRALHTLLFYSWEKVGDFFQFCAALSGLLETLTRKSFLSSYPLNLKMAQKLFELKEKFENASFSREPFTQDDMFRIFRHALGNELISFSGSPLKGLQILGLLETRSLSFESVVVMDANETALPALKIYEPLIPREVMVSLGLNRLEKEEEIQHYQFRRLISSAKDVYLVYQEKDTKEKSRFIEGLIWEEQKRLTRIEVLPVSRAAFKVKVLPKRLAIKKDPGILRSLENLEYSASSINTYLRCPLRFYYQYVLGLKEAEDSLEEPQGRDIGTFIHELLQESWGHFVGKKPRIDEAFRKDFFLLFDKKFADEIERKTRSDSFLIREVLEFRLKRLLDYERRRPVKELVCVEKTFRLAIPFNGAEFKFKAIIDRIDRLDDSSFLVIDYKTGGADGLPSTDIGKIVSAGFQREALKESIGSFQLPLYLYMVSSDKRFARARANAALYSIREAGSEGSLKPLFTTQEQFRDKERIMATYFEAMGSLLAEIIDPGVAFTADEEDSRQCQNCPFFYLCR